MKNSIPLRVLLVSIIVLVMSIGVNGASLAAANIVQKINFNMVGGSSTIIPPTMYKDFSAAFTGNISLKGNNYAINMLNGNTKLGGETFQITIKGSTLIHDSIYNVIIYCV
jgi:hypothetical protein